MAFLPLIALLIAANTAVGFIAPTLHVGHPTSSWRWSNQHSVANTRCRTTSDRSGTRGVGLRRSSGLSMEVEPHILRLQAAELGSRLRVRRHC